MTTDIADIAGPVEKKKPTHTKSILQSWTKMLRKMDVTFKALKHTIVLFITNTSLFPLPPKNNVEVRLDYFCP